MATVILIITFLFLLLGLAGSLIPLLPGNLLIGLTIVMFAWSDGLDRIGLFPVIMLTLISLAAGTADIWLPLVGAKTGGASVKAIVFGLVGAVIGFILGSFIPVVGNLIGCLAGYVGGILLSAYQEHGDWNIALKASLSGLAGWGLATVLQVIAALFTIIVFLALVLF